MEPASPYRPRISRETRLLLTTGIVAVAALWLLARIRFQDQPVRPSPVPSVLSQLATVPTHDDLASQIARLQARMQPWLLALDVPFVALRGDFSQGSQRIAALRFRDDAAITWFPAGSNSATWANANVRARDPASGLAVVRVSSPMPASPPASPLTTWTPRRLQQPRYLAASDLSLQTVSVRPTYVGSLDHVDSPLWSEGLWAAPPASDLSPGSFLFTNDAELVGLVIALTAGSANLAIVPGETVLAEAARLVDSPARAPGTVGLEVQSLTEAVAAATGTSTGLVVTWVEQDGASTGRLAVGDVIEAIDDHALWSRHHWDVRMARLSAGETLTLRVRGRGEVRKVTLVASAVAVQSPRRTLGLTLRGRLGRGAEVLGVEPASAADRAGLVTGDLITLFADVNAPTPADIVRSFGSLRQGQRVVIALTRGDAHHVTALER
jgi:PDZ domain